jgi:hypothetical protein
MTHVLQPHTIQVSDIPNNRIFFSHFRPYIRPNLTQGITIKMAPVPSLVPTKNWEVLRSNSTSTHTVATAVVVVSLDSSSQIAG